MAVESVCTRYVCTIATAFSITLRVKLSDGHFQFRTPERFAPGKFDIWGSSHQIFHVAILCAMYTHVIALTDAFTACHTMDLCKIQSAHRAG